jgi:DNA-directed RNA polymerase beta' subunit
MAGREGLIDTAVKTSGDWYIQRKLIKALEDARSPTIALCEMRIHRTVPFGEDGMDACSIEQQFFPPHDAYRPTPPSPSKHGTKKRRVITADNR